MRFAFIRDHHAEFPVEVLCDVLGVSRSGYYAWRDRPPSPAAARRGRLIEQIREAHKESRSTYGSPRVHRELAARGVACCENTVARLMTDHEIRAVSPRRVVRTTDSRHALPVADHVLDRAFDPDAPNRVWSADRTYVATGEGWLYLAVVEDLESRMIVGWRWTRR